MQKTLIWQSLILLGVTAVTYVIAHLLPWIMVLISLAVGGAAVATLVVPAARAFLQERFPLLATHPKRTSVCCGIVGYCLVLFLFSGAAIRENSRRETHDRKVAILIREAESALESDDLNAANNIVKQLEADHLSVASTQFSELKSRVASALRTKEIKRANERVLQIVIAGNQHLLAKRYDAVENDVKEAFAIQGANELQGAQQLADKLLKVKIATAKQLIAANDLDGATAISMEGDRLVGVTERRELSELFSQIANVRVAAKVAVATGHLDGARLDDAERELKTAVAMKNATELTQARTLLENIRVERVRLANATVAKLVAESAELSLEEAVQKLNEAIATPYATELAEAKKRLARADGLIREQEKKLAAEVVAREAETNRKLQAAAEVEEKRKAEEEFDANGLVLLRKTVGGKRGDFGGEITGEVVNRRKKKLAYAQISFNLYDESGAQVGSALANINNLEPGGKWKFKAPTLGTDFSSYKFAELSGF